MGHSSCRYRLHQPSASSEIPAAMAGAEGTGSGEPVENYQRSDEQVSPPGNSRTPSFVTRWNWNSHFILRTCCQRNIPISSFFLMHQNFPSRNSKPVTAHPKPYNIISGVTVFTGAEGLKGPKQSILDENEGDKVIHFHNSRQQKMPALLSSYCETFQFQHCHSF